MKHKDSIEDIIVTWKQSLGGIVPIKRERLKAMHDLIATLHFYGYTKEQVCSSHTRILIIQACVGHKASGTKRLNWTAAVMADIKIAVAKEWPSEMKEGNKQNRPTKTLSEYLDELLEVLSKPKCSCCPIHGVGKTVE